jgi:hyperosmotically inducible periplasmic protein
MVHAFRHAPKPALLYQPTECVALHVCGLPTESLRREPLDLLFLTSFYIAISTRFIMLKPSLYAVCCAFALAVVANTSYAQASDTTAATTPANPVKSAKKAQRADNRALAKRVRLALNKTKGLQSADITVTAKAGAVGLEGTVPEDNQISLAENTARSVNGVKSVTNYVRVAIKN